ncbi:MAG: coenzyme F420-0:L-glutamate ligase [Oscillospiraceae bacterium]|nr:coenzyme F420-0:L-glutamate ligase [Oscillospiraceae bacterium]
MKTIGMVSRGIRTPLVRAGDDIVKITVDSVLAASKEGNFELNDKDVIGITEGVVARSQGNYASCEQIAQDIRAKFPSGELALTFPILSRNRFGNILKGIKMGCDKLYIMLSYPSDEVGNELVCADALDKAGVNPHTDVLDEKMFREKFGYDTKHVFTGLDYTEYYKSFGSQVEIIYANDVRSILKFTKNVLCCDIHTRARSKRLLKESGAKVVYGLDEILTSPVSGSGYNELYGLLGSNKATENSVKLFPRACQPIVDNIALKLKEITGKQLEVMVFGDGAFKDPVGKIWELADPVVSPAFTPGLSGTPNELKLKFLLDNDFANTDKSELKDAVDAAIKAKGNKPGDKAMGTTPRVYTDLIGSLCDLMSGSGDKGTPVILIQGYFDNYAS